MKSLELQNFRNHAHTKVELCEGLNFIVGDNAQGKTNLIEAIYMTCIGRGFRSPRDREVIKFGQQYARVKTAAIKKFGKVNIEVTVSTSPGKTGKQIKINGIPIAKMGELMGSITCVFFNPDELKLVKESPADRRRFMDIDISQIDKNYFYNLLRYNKILKQRNALLKNISRSDDEMRSLDIWDEQLAAAGEQIVKRRIQFCEQLSNEVTGIHQQLSNGEDISIIYETYTDIKKINNRNVSNLSHPTVCQTVSPDLVENSDAPLRRDAPTRTAPTNENAPAEPIKTVPHIQNAIPQNTSFSHATAPQTELYVSGKNSQSKNEDSLRATVKTVSCAASENSPNIISRVNSLSCNEKIGEDSGVLLTTIRSARETDLRLRTTTVGPHRDDIMLSISGIDVRSYASQGQQRTVALSMKIAELKIFERATGERPILLLDDVLSELDQARQSKLLEIIQGWQSVITTTALPDITVAVSPDTIPNPHAAVSGAVRATLGANSNNCSENSDSGLMNPNSNSEISKNPLAVSGGSSASSNKHPLVSGDNSVILNNRSTVPGNRPAVRNGVPTTAGLGQNVPRGTFSVFCVRDGKII